jgi:hypothetical protein
MFEVQGFRLRQGYGETSPQRFARRRACSEFRFEVRSSRFVALCSWFVVLGLWFAVLR